MIDEILKASYSAKDCAFALQVAEISQGRRDLTRHNALYFPRHASSGPGGGEYRYAHILEMALHQTFGKKRRALVRSIVWGLDNCLKQQDMGLAKLNADGGKLTSIVLQGGSGFEKDDYPDGSPRDASWLVDFPAIFLAPDLISRDSEAPTVLLFDPGAHESGSANCKLVGNISLMEAQKQAIELLASSAADESVKSYLEERFDLIPALNLTSMLKRIDDRLALRLEAQKIRGA